MAKSFAALVARDKETWSEDAQRVYEAAGRVFEEEISAQRELGRLLANARKEKGLSQPALAAAAGIQQSEISRIENGLGNPTIETLSRLTTVLGQRITLVPQPT